MYDIITFDCYGTLVDWEGGISSAYEPLARGTQSGWFSACQIDLPVAWINRKRDEPAGTARPLVEVFSLSGLVDWLRSPDGC